MIRGPPVNRILFDKEEICDGFATFGGVRAEHVLNVLHGEPGQVLKTGVVDGMIGLSTIENIEPLAPDPTTKLAQGRITVRCVHDQPALAPWVDLLLAPPRPRAMKRLLPQLAQMGVGRIVLVGAEKVEKAFWGAQLLKEEIYRPLLLDGLMQAGTTALPQIQIERSFRHYLEKGRFGSDFSQSSERFVAHPTKGGQSPFLRGQSPLSQGLSPTVEGLSPSAEGLSPSEGGLSPTVEGLSPAAEGLSPCEGGQSPRGRVLVAVGPEGGWTDDEVDRLEAHGFARLSLGSRILRTDTAVIALLARLMPLD